MLLARDVGEPGGSTSPSASRAPTLSSTAMRSIPIILLASYAASHTAFGQLVRDSAALPPSQSGPGSGEAVALVDVDLDGDLDVVLARAGNGLGVAQCFLWINRGGAQGGTEGTFA